MDENKYSREEGMFVWSENKRSPVIELDKKRINVKTLKLNISRKHKIVLALDLLLIHFIIGLLIPVITHSKLSMTGCVIVGVMGFVMWAAALCKLIFDCLEWVSTEQEKLNRMGEWYCEDVVNICNGFLTAGVKVAAEEVEKVKNGEREKRADKENVCP